MRVHVCRTARQAVGWLRVLLRSLGCCPHLFSFEKIPKCNCTKFNPEERRRLSVIPADVARRMNSANSGEKRKKRSAKMGTTKRRRTLPPSPPGQETTQNHTRTVLTNLLTVCKALPELSLDFA